MLPQLKLASESSGPPNSRSYWVVENRFLTGAFPGSPDPETHRQKMKVLIDTGVSSFLNLMEDDEVDHKGQPFACYDQTAAELAAPSVVDCCRFPVRDVSIPTRENMSRILDHIDGATSSGQMVYAHCWGGIGRTGTVVGCWLLRHGFAKTDDVLQVISRLRTQDAERGHRTSPETEEQRQFVLNWRES